MADVSVRDRETRAYKRLILNVPPELHDRLRGMAERERRPLTTQVQMLIERALEDESTTDTNKRNGQELVA